MEAVLPLASVKGYTRSELESRLQSFLTSEWQRRNTPQGLKAAWADSSSATCDTTSKIFRESGFKAWLAFYLATHEAGSHHKGKKIGSAIKYALDQLSENRLREIANKLKDTVVHCTVEQAIGKMSTQMQLHEDEDCSLVSAAAATSPTPITINTAETTMPTGPTTSTPSHGSELVNIDPSAMYTADFEGQRFVHASPRGIMTIFPTYFCGAIRMAGTGAATRAVVAMHFPYQQYGSIHCLMSMSVVPSRLAAVTKELFDVILEVKGGIRYVISKGGGTMLPMPSVTIGGASEEGIFSLLGDYAGRGIETSPERKNELWQAIGLTSCATMTINNDPMEDGQLNLNLGLEEGLAIQRILYTEN